LREQLYAGVVAAEGRAAMRHLITGFDAQLGVRLEPRRRLYGSPPLWAPRVMPRVGTNPTQTLRGECHVCQLANNSLCPCLSWMVVNAW
jgi:hypothetical protein